MPHPSVCPGHESPPRPESPCRVRFLRRARVGKPWRTQRSALPTVSERVPAGEGGCCTGRFHRSRKPDFGQIIPRPHPVSLKSTLMGSHLQLCARVALAGTGGGRRRLCAFVTTHMEVGSRASVWVGLCATSRTLDTDSPRACRGLWSWGARWRATWPEACAGDAWSGLDSDST